MFSHQLNSKRNDPVLLFKTIFRHLGTSHNLSWRGGVGVEEKLGGLQFFLDGIRGALKCQKMTLGGIQVSFK